MSGKPFVPRAKRIRAIGDTPRGFPTIFEDNLHIPLPQPKAGEWLTIRKEPGQTYDQFVQSGKRPSKTKSTIYIQPLDEIPEDLLSFLTAFCNAFFLGATRISVQPTIMLSSMRVSSRMNDYGNQYHAKEIIDALKLPKDAFCMLAITMKDLYPRESWNFVYGLACGSKGVFSFIRHLDETKNDAYDRMWFLASKTMVHEIGHMFGIKHCIYYKCLMNGNNGNEKIPGYMCPVCLKKLHHALRFDFKSRFERLASVISNRPHSKFQKLLNHYIHMIELCGN